MKQHTELSLSAKIWISLFILLALAAVATITAALIMFVGGYDTIYGANVAVIPLEGEIVSSGDSFSGLVTSDTIIEDIQTAEEDDAIEAVLFRINSPGGSAVASDEIAAAIENMSKPSVAVIREIGASGAYWVASSCDHVVANRMSITGSIGVIGSYLSFGRFLDHWNVTYNQLTAGENKDVGTPFRELEPSERRFLQEKLDTIHTYFIEAVAANRNMSVENVRSLADGRFFLGSEAKDAGLVDELGGEQQALDWLETRGVKDPVLVVYEHEPSLLDILGGVMSQQTTTETLLKDAVRTDVPLTR